MNSEFIFKIAIPIFLLIISPVSSAIETQIMDSRYSPLLFSWKAATEPHLFPHMIQTFYPFTEARFILFLGDGFNSTQTNNEHSLAEYVRDFIDSKACIYKTDITCPDKLHGQSNKNLVYYRLDHQKPFPFESNQFDTIIMRKGLCCCVSAEESCAGLKYGSTETQNFFSEIVRVLNKQNPKATVFLTGQFRSRISQGPISFEEEQKHESTLQEILSQLEIENPDLLFEMFYTDAPVPFLVHQARIHFKKIRDLMGHFISKKMTFQNAGFQKVRFFEGIRIRVKPKEENRQHASWVQFQRRSNPFHQRGSSIIKR